MNHVLKEILTTGYAKSPNGNLVKVHSNISLKEGDYLAEIIATLRPKVTLEVGLAYGISALFICQMLKPSSGSRHIVIDPCQNSNWGGIGLFNLTRAGYRDVIDFYESPSQTCLPQLLNKGVKVDFAFIDGWHTFDHTLVDFFYVDKLLNTGGIVAFDDSRMPSISKVISFVAKNRSYTVVRSFNWRAIHRKTKETKSSKDNKIASHRSLMSKLNFAFHGKQALKDIRSFGAGIDPTINCVALQKEAEDNREWDFHSKF